MSRKRTKQYLMLLMVIGLVSIAAGGGGTFASFNAETTNAGNYFATGTLVLNDNGGNNTCTSASSSSSTNFNNGPTPGTDCDTLFKVNHFSFAATTLSLPNPLDSTAGASAVLTVAAITGDAIYPGDSLTITDGVNTENVTAKSYAAVGGTSVTVDASGLVHSYAAGSTITDNSDTQLAQLTLTNAGSIDANGIKFKAAGGCTAQYTEPHTTLNMGTVTLGASSTTTLTVSSIATHFQPNDTLVVSEGGHANTFIVVSQSSNTSITVSSAQNWNYAYDTSAVVSGPEFNGASAHNLCQHLRLSIIETTGTFGASLAAAAGCAYGNTGGTLAAANACNFNASPLLSAVPSTLTPLSINTASNSNSSGLLNAGLSRTFILAVHYDGVSAFDNTYQNTEAAAFDLTWHIDQV